jgi:hypothetical protein
MLRKLLLVLLMLGVAGFGLCTLCGGVMGVSMLTESRASDRDYAWFAFAMAALGGVLTWLCWLGCKAVLKRGKPPEPPSDPT